MTSHASLPSAGPPVADFDAALLDLDGVVYVGGDAVAHAAPALKAAREAGMALAFVTNNASRTPAAVADHLSSIGVPAKPDEVVTSAQAAARTAAEQLPPGARVLTVGATGLRQALLEQGFEPVDTMAEDPVAVVQGFDPEMTWYRLAEAAYGLQRGLPWIASNTDMTIPTPHGRAPGNGTLVGMLTATTGRSPVVCGKPEPPMHRETIIRTGAQRPLVVGDRLDTDIEGANRAGVESLLVFTGVTDAADVVGAPGHLRPTLLAADLRGLHHRHPAVTPHPDGLGWQCRRWDSRVEAGALRLSTRSERARTGDNDEDYLLVDDRVDGIRAACVAVWSAADAGASVPDPSQVADELGRVGLGLVVPKD
jgi:glycerol 3-phosphatase-2